MKLLVFCINLTPPSPAVIALNPHSHFPRKCLGPPSLPLEMETLAYAIGTEHVVNPGISRRASRSFRNPVGASTAPALSSAWSATSLTVSMLQAVLKSKLTPALCTPCGARAVAAFARGDSGQPPLAGNPMWCAARASSAAPPGRTRSPLAGALRGLVPAGTHRHPPVQEWKCLNLQIRIRHRGSCLRGS